MKRCLSWEAGRPRAVPVPSRSATASRAKAPAPRTQFSSACWCPCLPSRARPRGRWAVFWRRAAKELDEDDLSALEDLALTAGKAIENARQFEELHELAVRDPLTGLHNRRYFDDTLDHEVKRAHRYDRRLALIFFDLDDFKAINEDIGHLGGDSVLAEMAQRLGLVMRGADIPCRVGGDEFAVILPESSAGGCRALLPSTEARDPGATCWAGAAALQISAGMAELGRDDDATSLFRRVDQALYRAKRAGKGRVMPRRTIPRRRAKRPRAVARAPRA